MRLDRLHQFLTYTFFLTLIFCTTRSFAQGPTTFGGTLEDKGEAIIQTDNKDFIIAGYTESFGNRSDLDIYLVRTDEDGQQRWSQHYDFASIDHAYDVLPTADDGFILVGDTRTSPNTLLDILVMKVDANGQLEWHQTYGSTGNDQAFSIAKTNNGYAIAGRSETNPDAPSEAFVLHIDSEGNELWYTSFGDEEDDVINAVINDGTNLVVVGSTETATSTDIYLAKIDFSGQVLWTKTFGDAELDVAYDLLLTQDNHYLLAGKTNDNSDAFLLKTTIDGEEVWRNAYGGPMAQQIYSIQETAQGEIIGVGSAEVTNFNIDIYLLKTDANGEELYHKTLGNAAQIEEGIDVLVSDSGLTVVGYSSQDNLLFYNDILWLQTSLEGKTNLTQIRGNVFFDANNNCNFDDGERVLPNWLIEVQGENDKYYGFSDINGAYQVTVDTGTYDVRVWEQNNYWEADCIASYTVDVTETFGTINRNFPVVPTISCPYMQVDVSTDFIKSCANTSYLINYCNLGTANAEGAYVEVTLDEKLTFLNASLPIIDQDSSVYRFDLGIVEPGVCDVFEINVAVDCEGEVIGRAAYVEAHIYPDMYCNEVDEDWDGSSIVVKGQCIDGDLSFDITNKGTNTTEEFIQYYIVEDLIVFKIDSVKLGPEETERIHLDANASTYRLIAEQSEGHPGSKYPTVAIEGCGVETVGQELGFVTQFQENDSDPFIDIHVQEITGGDLSTQLLTHPRGYGEEHFIDTLTDITYQINFENTTNDTVYQIIIKDTLPEYLDLSTLSMGASSHPYRYEIYGEGILKITFDNLNLYPVTESSAGEQGFVQFKLSQLPNIPMNTVLVNRAAIYLGYESPVLTNSIFHTIGGNVEDFVEIVTSNEEVYVPNVNVQIAPNPFKTESTITLDGWTASKPLLFSLHDVNGRVVKSTVFDGNAVRIDGQELSAGLYLYTIQQADGLLINTGKLVVTAK